MSAQHQALTARTQPTAAVPRDPLSLSDYAARRSYAFDEAEAAFWSGAICAEAYMLFRLLTRLCKERTYCWPGLDYLAARLQASVGTVKRRLDRLERAGLIERHQRPGGLTSYTYVVPLQRYDAPHPASAPAPDDVQPPDVQPSLPQSSAQPLFFAPKEGISPAPHDRSAVIPQTIKSQSLSSGGGGRTFAAAEPSDPVAALLTAGGVVSSQVLAELKQTPLADVAACLHFAQQQPHIVDPAAFAVSLIRQGLGPRLAQQPRRRPRHHLDAPTPLSSDDPAAYRAYHCDHGQIRGSCARCAQPLDVRRSSPPPQPTDDGTARGGAAPAHEGSQIWPVVLAELERRLTPEEFGAWLDGTALLHLEGDQVVIGTPNVFVRERLARDYHSLIVAALETTLGRRPAIQYAIGSS